MSVWVPCFPGCQGLPIPSQVNCKMEKTLGQKPEHMPCPGPQYEDWGVGALRNLQLEVWQGAVLGGYQILMSYLRQKSRTINIVIVNFTT